MLILSLFPGIDLFGRPFEARGWCVVRGPEKCLGQDIVGWPSPPAGRFDGIIGGPPCQKYSSARRGQGNPWDGIPEFLRVVKAAQPRWWIMENVRSAWKSDIKFTDAISIKIRDWDCGGKTKRVRLFWFWPFSLAMLAKSMLPSNRPGQPEYSVISSSGNRISKRSFDHILKSKEAADLQGFPELAKITYRSHERYSNQLRVHWLGNGVPRAMGEWCASVVDQWDKTYKSENGEKS